MSGDKLTAPEVSSPTVLRPAQQTMSWVNLPLEIRQRVLRYYLPDLFNVNLLSCPEVTQKACVRLLHQRLGQLSLISSTFRKALLFLLETLSKDLDAKVAQKKDLRDSIDKLVRWPQPLVPRRTIYWDLIAAGDSDCPTDAMIETCRLHKAYRRSRDSLASRALNLRLEVANLSRLVDAVQYWIWRLRGVLEDEQYAHRARAYLGLVWKKPAVVSRDFERMDWDELWKIWPGRKGQPGLVRGKSGITWGGTERISMSI